MMTVGCSFKTIGRFESYASKANVLPFTVKVPPEAFVPMPNFGIDVDSAIGVGAIEDVGVGAIEDVGVGAVEDVGVGAVENAGVGSVENVAVGSVEDVGVGSVEDVAVDSVEDVAVGRYVPTATVLLPCCANSRTKIKTTISTTNGTRIQRTFFMRSKIAVC